MSAILTPVNAVLATSSVEATDPFLFRRARTWWLLLALFLLTQENGLFTRQDDNYFSLNKVSQRYESSPVLLLVTIVLWLICLGLLVGHIRPALRMMPKQKAVLAFAVLSILSTGWSQVPLTTLRHSLLLLVLLIFAWSFATYYSPYDQRRLLLAMGVFVAMASIAMALLLPQYGISSSGEWKGIFGQKNHLGLSMVFLFSGLPFHWRSDSWTRVLTAVGGLLVLSLILLSQSRTSLVLSAVMVAVRILGTIIPRVRRQQIPFVLFATIAASVFLFTSVPVIMALLGRDTTLTGRTDSWSLLFPYALNHWFLGYGFHGFWTGEGDSLSVMRSRGAGMHGSDSGYLDVMLQFGVVGLCVMFTTFIVSIRDFLKVLRSHTLAPVGLWYASTIFVIIVGSVTESLIPSQNGIDTFAFVVASAGLATLSRQVVSHAEHRVRSESIHE